MTHPYEPTREDILKRERELARIPVDSFKERALRAGPPRYPETNEETYHRVARFELIQEHGRSAQIPGTTEQATVTADDNIIRPGDIVELVSGGERWVVDDDLSDQWDTSVRIIRDSPNGVIQHILRTERLRRVAREPDPAPDFEQRASAELLMCLKLAASSFIQTIDEEETALAKRGRQLGDRQREIRAMLQSWLKHGAPLPYAPESPRPSDG